MSTPVSPPAKPVVPMPAVSDYAALYAIAKLDDASTEAPYVASTIISHKADYDVVAKATGAPWWWIGCIHMREASGNFRCHLHNGDPLTARTVHVPAGRPLVGTPPFTWVQSAIDALHMEGITPGQTWDLVDTLSRTEAYNGFGYRHCNIRSPYLWAGTNLQQPGKFVADGKLDLTVTDKQLGVAGMMLALEAKGIDLFAQTVS